MRKTVLILNGIVIVFFACFIAYTFVAQAHLESLARGFVTEKTLEYSKPVIDGVEETLNSSKLLKLVPKKKKALIQDEIDAYREDPMAYISDLTGNQLQKEPTEITNPLLLKVVGYKDKIRTFYEDTLHALIRDLRIVSICNLIAGVIAFILACIRGMEVSKTLLGFSIIIFGGVLYCSYVYVDDLSFFKILFRWHMGWSYGVFLFLMIIALFQDYGEEVMKLVKNSDDEESSESAAEDDSKA